MAKNLYEVVLNLLVPFLMLSMVSSINYHFTNKKIKFWHYKGLLIVFALTFIVSVLRQWRFIKYNQINNIYLLCTAFFAGLLYIILVWIYFTKLQKKFLLPFEITLTILGLLYIACLMLYKVPVVLFLPLQFLGIGENVFTTMYLLKVTGFCLAWLLCILISVGLCAILTRSDKKTNALCFSVFYLLGSFIYFVSVVGIINSYYRKKIKIPLGLRKSLPKLITAENLVFVLVIILLLVIAIVFITLHLKIHGEYENPAQLRLLKRYERDCRRLGLFAFCLASFFLIDATLVKKMASRLVELSPSEDFQIEGNRIFIPLEQVSDGHLHRFSWENGKGKTVRFIIVQKKGTNFGIGFDACEVCGNVGYYERKNDIVCNRCDVVMNRNTIGLKGGCNPIPLQSSIEDGGIVIFTDDLNREAGRF